MNKFTKFFKALAVLTALAFSAATFADVVIYNPTATTAASVLQNGVKIQQIQYSNAATNAITITMYDAPTNVLTYVVGAYTNNVISQQNVVTTFTNYTGIVESQTNLTLVSTLTPVGQSTNSYRTVIVQTVPASSTVTFTPPSGLPVGFGLAAATTATNITASIIYLPTR